MLHDARKEGNEQYANEPGAKKEGCFRCGHHAHYARECPNRRRLLRQGPYDQKQFKNNPRQQNSNNKPQSPNTIIDICYLINGSCLKINDCIAFWAHVEGTYTRMFVDTQSTWNMISASLIPERTSKMPTRASGFCTVMGVMQPMHSVHLKWSVNGVEMRSTFEVVETSAFEVILGNEWLRENRADISFSRNEIRLENGLSVYVLNDQEVG